MGSGAVRGARAESMALGRGGGVKCYQKQIVEIQREDAHEKTHVDISSVFVLCIFIDDQNHKNETRVDVCLWV